MKSISSFFPGKPQGEYNNGPNRVQLSECLSLREIVERSLKGYPIPENSYYEDFGEGLPENVRIENVRQPIYETDEMIVKDFYISQLEAEKASALRGAKSGKSVAETSSEPPKDADASKKDPEKFD